MPLKSDLRKTTSKERSDPGEQPCLRSSGFVRKKGQGPGHTW